MEKTEIEIEDLVEIKLFEAEDFLKIKEKIKNYINLATSFIREVSTISYISKNYLH